MTESGGHLYSTVTADNKPAHPDYPPSLTSRACQQGGFRRRPMQMHKSSKSAPVGAVTLTGAAVANPQRRNRVRYFSCLRCGGRGSRGSLLDAWRALSVQARSPLCPSWVLGPPTSLQSRPPKRKDARSGSTLQPPAAHQYQQRNKEEARILLHPVPSTSCATAVMLTERDLEINPIVQESVLHNTKVRPVPAPTPMPSPLSAQSLRLFSSYYLIYLPALRTKPKLVRLLGPIFSSPPPPPSAALIKR
jgi:hypothetical protein